MPRRLSETVTGAEPLLPDLTAAEKRATVESHLGLRVRLADYRSTIEPLTTAERESIIEQAILVLEHLYAHLSLKRAIHAVEPIQRLRLLQLRHEAMTEREFQSYLIDTFVGLRDLHTLYLLPEGYRAFWAFLPFRVEEFYRAGKRRYVVSWVSPVNTIATLKEGVEVTHWNGMPIELAVARNAEKEAGSNVDARRAQGIEALTLRWFGASLPPDEDWVTLTYVDGNTTHDSRLHWEVIDSSNDALLFRGLGGGSVALRGQALGLDLKTALLQRMRTSLFDPEAMVVRREVAKTRSKRKAGRRRPSKLPEGNVSSQPDVFTRFGEVTTPSGVYGYIRLKSFSPESEDVDGTVEEFARILRAMPASGLILDVRGNPGGFINIGERSLQLLTPKAIQPEPFHFVASPQTLAMATTRNGLKEWAEPIKRGIETGAGFSQGFPLTSVEACNDIGQVYQGPVVLITDALCYSTTDMFAAGFQDHAIGRILGVHQATGAGGANVWDHADHLVRLRLDRSPYVALPRNAGMSVAVRRSTRVGMRSGVPLEDLGVSRDEKYEMTLTDVLKHNVDLIAHAAKILKALPKQTLSVTPATDAPVSRVRVASTGIDRLDFCVDGRPVASVDVAGAAMTVTIPSAKRGSVIKGEGYRRGELVASTRVKVR